MAKNLCSGVACALSRGLWCARVVIRCDLAAARSAEAMNIDERAPRHLVVVATSIQGSHSRCRSHATLSNREGVSRVRRASVAAQMAIAMAMSLCGGSLERTLLHRRLRQVSREMNSRDDGEKRSPPFTTSREKASVFGVGLCTDPPPHTTPQQSWSFHHANIVVDMFSEVWVVFVWP